jgi:hypothetical protein
VLSTNFQKFLAKKIVAQSKTTPRRRRRRKRRRGCYIEEGLVQWW